MEQKGFQNCEKTQRCGISGHRLGSTLALVQGEEGVQQFQGHKCAVGHG